MSIRDDLVERLERENDMLRERVRQLEAEMGFYCPVPIELGLTGKEAAVFGCLLRRDFCTKDAIMAAAYRDLGRDQPELKIVDVFICKIRAKVKPYDIAIETAWGQGYLIAPRVKADIFRRWPELLPASAQARPAA